MANLLLGVTGSVAALRTPELYAALKQAGHHVKVIATQASLYFFDPVQLDPSQVERNPDVVILDDDEWPGQNQGRRWQRDDPVLHIELRRWAELLVIAPLDANTLAKLACGLADNCLTCVWRAWDLSRPVVLAPAMNTLMWEHALTRQHLAQVAGMATGRPAPTELNTDDLIGWINQNCRRLRIVAPQSKRLVCGDIGVGALAESTDLVAAVSEMI